MCQVHDLIITGELEPAILHGPPPRIQPIVSQLISHSDKQAIPFPTHLPEFAPVIKEAFVTHMETVC